MQGMCKVRATGGGRGVCKMGARCMRHKVANAPLPPALPPQSQGSSQGSVHSPGHSRGSHDPHYQHQGRSGPSHSSTLQPPAPQGQSHTSAYQPYANRGLGASAAAAAGGGVQRSGAWGQPGQAQASVDRQGGGPPRGLRPGPGGQGPKGGAGSGSYGSGFGGPGVAKGGVGGGIGGGGRGRGPAGAGPAVARVSPRAGGAAAAAIKAAAVAPPVSKYDILQRLRRVSGERGGPRQCDGGLCKEVAIAIWAAIAAQPMSKVDILQQLRRVSAEGWWVGRGRGQPTLGTEGDQVGGTGASTSNTSRWLPCFHQMCNNRGTRMLLTTGMRQSRHNVWCCDENVLRCSQACR